MKKLLAILMALVLALGMLPAFAEEEAHLFETVDTEGNPVTEEIFADYDLTMVNIFASWCMYCIEEMPYFGLIKDNMPENVNLVTICTDYGTNKEYVDLILEILSTEFSVEFTTLVGTEEMLMGGYLDFVMAYPTTIFVDSEGNIVGDIVQGNPNRADPAGAYLALINDRLELLK